METISLLRYEFKIYIKDKLLNRQRRKFNHNIKCMSKKIVFFDSGIGGLSTLAACLNLCPTLQYIYVADNKNAPYGKLSAKQIMRFTEATLKPYLTNPEVAAIVLACNTATNCAIERLRSLTSTKIIGTEPAIIPALKSTAGKILVLATPATIAQPKFKSLISNKQSQLIISPQPNLASLIEQYFESKSADIKNKIISELKKSAQSKENFCSIVLGCTHYSLIADIISEVFKVKTFDGNLGVANELARFISAANLTPLAKSFPQILTTKKAKMNYATILSEQLKKLQN